MSALGQDLRHAVRLLRAAPAFAAIAVLTIALGIGANTSLFTIVNGVLLNPLPYPRSSELLAVYADSRETTQGYITYLNFLDWERDNQTLASMAMYRNQDYNFTGDGAAERLGGQMVSAGFFRTLGIAPVVGRLFDVSDDQIGAAPVVILGGGFWQRRFGGARDVVGRTMILNGSSYTVAGVLPADFTFYGPQRDVYTPLGQLNDPSFRDRRIDLSAHAIARLKPGVSLTQASADMDGVARDLAQAYPDADKGVGIHLVPMKQDLVGDIQPLLVVLMAAVGFVLLIACANVANLLLARSVGRAREFAIRVALGATHPRVVRQLFTESAILASLGGTLGFLVAMRGTRTAVGLLPRALPRTTEIAPDLRVLAFTLAASTLAAIVFGLAPALKASRVDVQDVLKSSARGSTGARHRTQGVFVAAEIALAVVLLVGAGLMIRSLAALWRVDPGFAPDHAVTFSVSLPGAAKATPAETRARLRALDDAMRAIPGVEAVSTTLGSRPMIHDSSLPFWIEGEPKPATTQDMHQAMFYLVEEGFQPAMGLTVERGRFISARDDEHAPVVIDIDDVFARTYFPGQNPIGRRVNFVGFDVQAEIVGVVGHVRQWGPGADPATAIEAQFDYPFMQLPERLMPLVSEAVAVIVRTTGDPAAVMPGVRRVVAALEPGEVVYNVQTLTQVIGSSLAARRLSMLLLVGFAGLALLLGSIGIYGVISYLVDQRAREIGVRLALGARREDILRLIVGHGARMAVAGVAIGGVAALGLTRVMTNQLFGVTPHDPATFAAVAALLLVVSLLACYVPARRASRVDPLVSLGRE